MAPTNIIENITVGRPLKATALVCGASTVFAMLLALFSSEWLLAIGWRQGLFEYCIEKNAPRPLPFKINADAGCYMGRDEPYIIASQALGVACLLLGLVATIMMGVGLNHSNLIIRQRYYRIAQVLMTLALIAILAVLILFPVFFAQEFELGNRTLWAFGWAYAIAWCAAVCLFLGVVLLLCDQEEEEIYYKESEIITEEKNANA